MPLGLELLHLVGELLHLLAVHQEGDLEVVALEHVHDAPDAHPVAVLALGDGGHVLLENGILGRQRVTDALERAPGGIVVRPHLPRNDECDAYLGVVRPLNGARSGHGEISSRPMSLTCMSQSLRKVTQIKI